MFHGGGPSPPAVAAAAAAAAAERVLDRPGRSVNVPLSGYAPPRVLSHIVGSDDTRATSTQIRVPIKLHLSHRVLTYIRHRLWGLQLTTSSSAFQREPVDVSERARRRARAPRRVSRAPPPLPPGRARAAAQEVV